MGDVTTTPSEHEIAWWSTTPPVPLDILKAADADEAIRVGFALASTYREALMVALARLHYLHRRLADERRRRLDLLDEMRRRRVA